MFKDRMTPKERATALAKGEKVDRLPCNPNLANGVARVYGCKISEFNTNPKVLAEAQVAAWRKFGYDSIRIFTDLFPWAEAMGAKVITPEMFVDLVFGDSIKNKQELVAYIEESNKEETIPTGFEDEENENTEENEEEESLSKDDE